MVGGCAFIMKGHRQPLKIKATISQPHMGIDARGGGRKVGSHLGGG
jgi:hypothetical protein